MLWPVNGRCAGRTGFGRSDGGVEGVKNLLKKVALRDDGVKGSEVLWLIIIALVAEFACSNREERNGDGTC
jgi:hypothetical protein